MYVIKSRLLLKGKTVGFLIIDEESKKPYRFKYNKVLTETWRYKVQEYRGLFTRRVTRAIEKL